MTDNPALQNVEAVYPLSPLQHGMLFHSLLAPGSGVYVTQWTCVLTLDLPRFLRACQQVMQRHSVLRTAFVWEGFHEPLQVVGRQVRLPYEEQDWRGLSAVEQQERLEAFLQEDRKRGFNFSVAPLMRLTFLRLAANEY